MTRLKELRQERKETQAEIAALIGITRAAYTNIELGNREPDFATLSILADHFGVSVDYLLGRDNTAEKAPTQQGERRATEYEIKFALFGGAEEITDEMYEEVKRFAEYVKQRNAMLKKKKGEE